MNYDEVLEGSKRVKAPSLEEDERDTGTEAASESIINALKVVDRRTRVSIRILQGIFAFMTLFAVGFIIVTDNAVTRAGIGSLILSFLLVIFTQHLRYKAYNESYFNRPMIEYLQRAKQRMKVFTIRSWIAIPAWVAIDVGICLLIYAASDRFPFSAAYIILAIQVPIVMAAAADFLVEYLIWWKEHRPTVARIDGILNEIESSLVSD